MKKLAVFGFFLFLLLQVCLMSQAAQGLRKTIPIPKDWEVAKWHGALHKDGTQSFFAVMYPAKIFEEGRMDAGVELRSVYRIGEFPYSIHFEVKEGEMADVMKQNGPVCYMVTVVAGSREDYGTDKDCFRYIESQGKGPGKYTRLSTPAKWAYTLTTYSLVSEDNWKTPETLVITEKMLDYTAPSGKSETSAHDLFKQNKLLEIIIGSLEIRTHGTNSFYLH